MGTPPNLMSLSWKGASWTMKADILTERIDIVRTAIQGQYYLPLLWLSCKSLCPGDGELQRYERSLCEWPRNFYEPQIGNDPVILLPLLPSTGFTDVCPHLVDCHSFTAVLTDSWIEGHYADKTHGTTSQVFFQKKKSWNQETLLWFWHVFH